jgi:hypothetical protein
VLPERRVPGGAVLELWAQGDAEFRVPLPEGVSKGRLFLAGGRPGTLGAAVSCSCESGVLGFKTQPGGPRHFHFVAEL